VAGDTPMLAVPSAVAPAFFDEDRATARLTSHSWAQPGGWSPDGIQVARPPPGGRTSQNVLASEVDLGVLRLWADLPHLAHNWAGQASRVR
jgi:hypothetical protein